MPEVPETVVRDAVFAFTTEPLTKFVPTTLSVNAGPLAVTLFGERSVMVGTVLAGVIG